jgi:hypothetical protein
MDTPTATATPPLAERGTPRVYDRHLTPPHRRAELLDVEIRRMELDGYIIAARPSGHVAIMTRDRRRVQLFIDEYGELDLL